MRYVVLFLFGILCISTSHAQSITTASAADKFIEVKVADTLLVQPDVVVLMVKFEQQEEDYFDDDYSYDDNNSEKEKREKENMKKQTFLQIESILKNYSVASYQYHEKSANKNPFSKDFSIYEDAYEVKVTNIKTLDNLQSDLKAIKDVGVSITQTNVNDKHSYELQLLDKLMQKATKEAKVIASSMKVTLGNPINVSNQSWDNITTSMFNNTESMGAFGAIFGMLGNMFKSSTGDIRVTISKTIVVRYSYQ